MKKPNIILFITHDQGQFIRCYNSEITPNALNTPNLDKLAEKGIRFTNHFCTAPQCSPSRGSIQTSLYPHQNGLMGLVNRGWNLPESNKTLPMYLHEQGYSTHLIGLEHEAREVSTLGYESVSKRKSAQFYMLNRTEKLIIQFLEDHSKDKKPFFLNIGAFEVHRPFELWNEPVNPKNVIVPSFLSDHEMVRKDLAQYYGVISIVDEKIGKIQSKLEETDLMDDTLFIFTTDHGCPFPRAKCTLYDPGIKTSLIMNYSGSELFSGGKVFDQLVSNIDLLPSLIEFVSSKSVANVEGKSFIPILSQPAYSFRNEIYAEKSFHELYDPMRCIRTDRFKYIHNFEKLETLYQLPLDIIKDPSGQFVKDRIKIPRPERELYDLINDPHEQVNLMADSEYENVAKELEDMLFNWLKRTNDPILRGKILPQENVNFNY